MRLNKYPSYKDSGSLWLGKVPEHWDIRNLRTLIRSRNERNRANLPLLSVAREKGVFVRSLTDAKENHNVIPEDLSNYKVARTGNLIINKMKAWQGSMGIAPCDGIVSPAYFVYDFGLTNRAFGQALLRSKPYVAHFAQASDGVRIGQWDLTISGMRQIPVLVPPLPEQTAIVKFLDHYDRKIKKYIKAKLKLIKLLEEQKQSIIHRAVTGQINVRTGKPYANYKPSGVEWLGDVPEHWEVIRLKRVSPIQGGYAFPADSFCGVGIPVVRMNNIRRGTLDFSQVVRISEHHCKEAFALKEGDIVYGLSGSIGATGSLGNYAVVKNSDLPAQLNQRVARLQPSKNRITEGFLLEALQTNEFYEQVLANTTGTAQFNVSTNDIGNVALALPPLDEQKQIVGHLKSATTNMVVAIDHANREISLLREYRTRLIADVVTGKLDVREAAKNLPDEPAEQEETEAPEEDTDELAIEDEIVDNAEVDEGNE